MNLADLKVPFERYVTRRNPDDCWEWQGPKDGRGYGKLCHNKHQYVASRVSVAIDGRPAGAWHVVCHKCDNPLCVNPNHLFVGSQADNVRDMHAKGRAALGEQTRSAKLDAPFVRGIRFLATLGRKQNVMARQFGVSQMTISRIVRRQAWKHVL